jgi:hypothetical protein
MKWFSSSAMFGVSSANKLGFGLDLAGICQTILHNDNTKEDMACPKSTAQSHPKIVSSLIQHTLRK